MYTCILSSTYPFGWVLNEYTDDEKLDVNPCWQRTYDKFGGAKIDVSAYAVTTYDKSP